jgi:transcriptional regulator PpsR
MSATLAQPDVTLLLDDEGVIRDVTVSNAVAEEGMEPWRGRPWMETVADSGGGKIRLMVQDALANGVSAYRQINQRFPSGLEVAMEYTTVRLGGQGGLMAIGRSVQAVAELQSRLIAAQQSMEQDYWRLREVETRYRLLFDASNEAVLLIRVDNLRIAEANPAAIRALGLGRGREFLSEIAAEEREGFKAMLARVREQGRGPGALIHMGAERRSWTVRASLMTAEAGPVFLLQILPVGAAGAVAERADPLSLPDLVERLPDAFVVADQDGVVRRANRSFVEMVQLGAEGAVLGEKLSRWLSRPGADMGVLMANLQRHGVVRRFATGLMGDLGSQTEVEISAIGDATSPPRFIGLMIRDMTRREPAAEHNGSLRGELAEVMEQIGKTSLPKLVRDTVSVVERHCIDVALQLSEGNRSAAAELLGLSRQSLYEKLNRYDL